MRVGYHCDVACCSPSRELFGRFSKYGIPTRQTATHISRNFEKREACATSSAGAAGKIMPGISPSPAPTGANLSYGTSRAAGYLLAERVSEPTRRSELRIPCVSLRNE